MCLLSYSPNKIEKQHIKCGKNLTKKLGKYSASIGWGICVIEYCNILPDYLEMIRDCDVITLDFLANYK